MGEQEKRKENNKMVNRSHAELRYLETDDVLFGENRLLMGLFCLKRHRTSWWGIYSVGGSTCEDSWLRIRAILLKSDACGWLVGSINESENLMVLCNEWRDKRGKLRFHLISRADRVASLTGDMHATCVKPLFPRLKHDINLFSRVLYWPIEKFKIFNLITASTWVAKCELLRFSSDWSKMGNRRGYRICKLWPLVSSINLCWKTNLSNKSEAVIIITRFSHRLISSPWPVRLSC